MKINGSKKKIITRLIALLLVVCVLAGAILGIRVWQGQKTAVPVFELSTMATDSMDMGMSDSSLYGTVSADQVQTIYVSDTETVTEVFVKEGQAVKKGDALLAYDTTLTDLEITRKDLDIQKEKLELADLKAQASGKATSSSDDVLGSSDDDDEDDSLSTDSSGPPEESAALEAQSETSEVKGDDSGNDSDSKTSETDQDSGDDGSKSDSGNSSGSSDSGSSSGSSDAGSSSDSGSGSSSTSEKQNANSTAIEKATESSKKKSTSSSGSSKSSSSDDDDDDDSGSGSSKSGSSSYSGGSSGSTSYSNDSGASTSLSSSEIADIKAEIKEKEVEIKMDENELAKMKKEMDNGKVVAKLDGVVASVQDADTARTDGTPIVKVTGDGGFKINCTIDEYSRDSLTVGEEVTVQSYESGNTFTGEVASIGDAPDDSQDTMSSGSSNVSYYPFVVNVSSEANLSDNEYVSITRNSSQVEESSGGGFYIEDMYILKEGSKRYVYVRGDDDKLEKRQIKTGTVSYGSTQILSGLDKDSDWIAFPYGKNIKDGAKTVESTTDVLYSEE